MIKATWEIVNKTFDLLVVIFTLIILTDKFRPYSIGVSLDYFLYVILIFGFFSILLRSLSGEH